MKPKPLAIIIPVINATAITFLFMQIFPNSAMDINMHDTYFVIVPSHMYFIYSMVFLLTAFSGHGFAIKFKSRIENCILLILFLIANIGCTKLIIFSSRLYASVLNMNVNLNGSATFSHKFYKEIYNEDFLTLMFSSLQIILTLLLVVVAIITGKNWHKATLRTKN